MTKKNFVAAAKVVANLEISPKKKSEMAKVFSTFFKAENPRFDEDKFIAACLK